MSDRPRIVIGRKGLTLEQWLHLDGGGELAEPFAEMQLRPLACPACGHRRTSPQGGAAGARSQLLDLCHPRRRCAWWDGIAPDCRAMPDGWAPDGPPEYWSGPSIRVGETTIKPTVMWGGAGKWVAFVCVSHLGKNQIVESEELGSLGRAVAYASAAAMKVGES